jgi:hypothetical protein
MQPAALHHGQRADPGGSQRLVRPGEQIARWGAVQAALNPVDPERLKAPGFNP